MIVTTTNGYDFLFLISHIASQEIQLEQSTRRRDALGLLLNFDVQKHYQYLLQAQWMACKHISISTVKGKVVKDHANL